MSNLPYLSKTIERVVAARLSAHMSKYNLCEHNQSAYKPNHSVEMALVCEQNDILRAMDNQNIVIMLLLDLSAAFGTVDHNVILRRLSRDVGVVQTALDWYGSYLSDIVQSVHISGCTSPTCHLACGVPQGSALGPQLFSIYAAPLSKIIRNNNLISHFYARAQWLRCIASDSRLREPAFESYASVLKHWARFFTLHCSSSLSCIYEYLAIGSGGYVYEQPWRINCSTWLDASQRS